MGKNKPVSSSGHIDMLHGKLFGKILVFALPLFLSGILQQSFNSVDIAVVGRWAGREALAAVGNNGMVISLIINLFVGISVGANVVIANYVGRNDDNGIRNAIRTSAMVAVWSGVFLLCVGLAVAEPLLRWLDTPDDVLGLAVLYLRIFSLGMPFMMIYNFGSAILRSMGDTRRPFYALVVSGIVNASLNLLLVIVFDMGVAGVAIGTVVANVVNAGMIVLFLLRERAPFRLELKEWRMSRPDLRKILKIGLPAGVQGMVFSISNVFILASINGFGAHVAAGSSAALNFEYYCYFAISAFAQAAVAFISQNYGAGLYDRCRKVFRTSLMLAFLFCAAMNLFIGWQREMFVSIFSTDPEVIRYAAIRIECVLMFQFIACSYEISGAAMRGLGYSMTPTVLTIFGTCVFRLGWVWWISHHGGSFAGLMIVYPVSWTITGLAVYTAYRVVSRRVLRVIPSS